MLRCFVDMDGVLVDFNKGALDLFGREDPYDDPANRGCFFLDQLLGLTEEEFRGPLGRDFWANLRPTPECHRIIEFLEMVFGPSNICILTAPIDTEGCMEGKLDWLKAHLPPRYRKQFLMGKPKWFAASSNAWLIDDWDHNVVSFREGGGQAILYPRPWNSEHLRSGEDVFRVLEGAFQ
jgi:5'(3')-deoxyribonucleotidase